MMIVPYMPYYKMSLFCQFLRLLNQGIVLYTGIETQTNNPVVNIKPLYHEIHSAGTHMCVHHLLCVCVCIYLVVFT